MAIQHVIFHIPDWIAVGLASGDLRRVGGVIMRADNGRVVAWLRDLTTIATPIELFNALGVATKTAIALASGGTLLTLALAAASLVDIRNRVQRLSTQIETLRAELRAEFEQDRDAEFISSLRTANMVLTSSNADTRRDNALNAINRLYKVQENFISNYEKLRDSNQVLGAHYLNRAMYAATSCARCYLEIGETRSARQSLHDDLKRLNPHITGIVTALMGKHPALFFHKNIERGDVERFIVVQNWLEPRGLMDLIESLREDFWNEEVQQTGLFGQINRLRGSAPRTLQERVDELPEHLTLAELIIENYQRLQSFEMETLYLMQANLAFDDWQALATDDMLQEAKSGVALIELDVPVNLSEFVV